MEINETDYKAIRHLMEQGRITWSELAGILELSAPATADRVRRLEERQVITGYAALVDPEAIGCALTAFISIRLDKPKHQGPFLKKVESLPEVQECHHVTGDDDYLLKIRCSSAKDLERLVNEEIKGVTGVSRTSTMIALSTVKETPVLPVKLNQSSD
ncbi:MAG: Lrp/AsnC family transcriptional regulator [Elainellaceae cyanobacterium]